MHETLSEPDNEFYVWLKVRHENGRHAGTVLRLYADAKTREQFAALVSHQPVELAMLRRDHDARPYPHYTQIAGCTNTSYGHEADEPVGC